MAVVAQNELGFGRAGEKNEETFNRSARAGEHTQTRVGVHIRLVNRGTLKSSHTHTNTHIQMRTRTTRM